MPAYHLMAPDGDGITLVNIGVGPSNAKTICDHLAVLRPEAWLMIGHCGGLRPSQSIGDYVLAHAYLRDDHVLDDVLPPEIPIPADRRGAAGAVDARPRRHRRERRGAEAAAAHRHGRHHRRPQLGAALHPLGAALQPVARGRRSTWNRRPIAAQGYRFRVPYGTLLCVSDKPLHGEIKLPGQANRFYERAISQHLQIGIETLRACCAREGAAAALAQAARVRRAAVPLRRASEAAVFRRFFAQ